MKADIRDNKIFNKIMCSLFPWIVPRNRWSGKPIDTTEKGFWPGSPDKIPDWDYEYTELNDIPSGWFQSFGMDWVHDIQKIYNKFTPEEQDRFYIVQLKEKFGSFRQYFSFSTEELNNIIDHYEALSETVCICCGSPAEFESTGWISPWCKECASELKYENFVRIDGDGETILSAQEIKESL